MESFDTAQSIQSYRDYVPDELKRSPTWMIAIGRRPLLPHAGDKRSNLFTFDKALAKLADEDWLAARRAYLVEKHGDKFNTEPAHLMFITSETDICFADVDHRRLLDSNGNPVRKDGGGYRSMTEFGPDQVVAMDQVMLVCPGWRS